MYWQHSIAALMCPMGDTKRMISNNTKQDIIPIEKLSKIGHLNLRSLVAGKINYFAHNSTTRLSASNNYTILNTNRSA